METVEKVYCLFEQSGTFKNAFIKLGIPAEDYDIENRFGETNKKCDLFQEIEKAYKNGKDSFLCDIEKGSIVFAFFPCTYFSCQSRLAFSATGKQYKNCTDLEKLERALELERKRAKYFSLLCKLAIVSIKFGFRLVVENPFTAPHYLSLYFPVEPKIIHMDRRKFGDEFKKPTQYWFFGFQPAFNLTQEVAEAKGEKKIEKCNNAMERSLIDSLYAEMFIKNYIL